MSDRKYGQRGYQDSDRREREKPRPSAPRDPSAGPRGRGFGRPTATVFRCAVCGHPQSAAEIGVESQCQKCRADLHTCTHCTFFDTSVPKECRHPEAEYVASKAKRNLCEYFKPRLAQELEGDRETPSNPRAAFDALFKI